QALHERIAQLAGTSSSLPLPMTNILSGGLHAGGGMDVQDFLVVPLRATSVDEAIHAIARVRSAASDVLRARGLPTLLADEGGLAPGCATSREALELLVESIERAHLVPGADMGIAIDVAASTFRERDGGYRLTRERRTLASDAMVEMIEDWVRDFPVVSVEDGLAEEDWQGWKVLTARLGSSLQVVGD